VNHFIALILLVVLMTGCTAEPATAPVIPSTSTATPSPIPATATITPTPLPTGTSTITATPTARTASISLPGNQCWIDSGVEISSGDQVFLSATGFINTWGGRVGSSNDPDGQYKKTCGDVKCPLQGADYGALLGRVGEGETFLVGTGTNFSAQTDGNLYLTINDWDCSDNSGDFAVVISYGKELVATPTPTNSGVWNLTLNQPVSASRGEAERPPKYAGDGDLSTDWGSGAPPPQWIEIDLGAPARIERIHLLVTQYPSGETVHRILIRAADGEFSEVHRFEQYTSTGDWLEFIPEEPFEGVQMVRIETLKSPSWVGWIEVEVIGEK